MCLLLLWIQHIPFLLIQPLSVRSCLPAAGGIMWRKDFGPAGGSSGGSAGASSAPEAFTGLQVDPLDRRRLVLCGARGSFIVLW